MKKAERVLRDKKKPVLQWKKIIIYLILLVVVVYIIYTIYLLIKQPTNTFTVEEGNLYLEETNIGYVIRDEKVVKGQNYKNGMEQIKSEGEKAAVNESVFRYYSTNEEDLKNKISELDNKIQEAMSVNNELFSSDVKLLEDQIDEKMTYINKMTDIEKLEEYKKEINDLVTKKAKIAGDLSPQGSYLNQLINERKEYENQLNSGAEYIKAPMSGIVSYRVDGLEETLTVEGLGSLTEEYLDSLNLKTGKIIASNSECGKVINNFECYIATVSSSEQAKEANVGDSVDVRLSNNVEIPAEITNLSKEDDGDVLIVLKIKEQIEELIDYRKISFDLIWWSYSGLKVPNQAIINQDGLNYVVRNRAGYLSELLVNVKKQNDKYAIVQPYTTEELSELGFSSEEITAYKKIALYDEIVLNPDLSKVE